MSSCKRSFDKRFFFLCSDCEEEGKPNIDCLSVAAKKPINKTNDCVSLFFILEGDVEVSYGEMTRMMKPGYFFLIPANKTYSIQTSDMAKLMVCRLEEKQIVGYKKKGGLLFDICNARLPDNDSGELLDVKTNRYVQALLEDCTAVMNSGLLCARYTQCKTEELLILLRSYYPNEMLARLFNPAFNCKVYFIAAVKNSKGKFFTVDEYAAATNLDRNTFRQKFKETYGVNPTDWLQQEKANRVLEELVEGKKPITSIISDYNFSNFPNFIRFCNMHYKNTPGNIRKAWGAEA